MLAADLLREGGSRADARRMWQQMYEQAEEGIIRNNAKLRLEILDSLDRADGLAAAASEHRRRTGRPPAARAAARGRPVARAARGRGGRALRL
jgi:hypothetical protein